MFKQLEQNMAGIILVMRRFTFVKMKLILPGEVLEWGIIDGNLIKCRIFFTSGGQNRLMSASYSD